MDASRNGAEYAELWARLERSAAAIYRPVPSSSPSKDTADEEASAEGKKQRRKRIIRRLDVIAGLFWPYALIRLFVIDIDRKILEALWGGAAGRLVDYRALLYLALLMLLVITLKKKVVLYFLYVGFFPLIVLFWKLPRAIAIRRSWLLLVAVVHIVSTVVSSLGYNILTKGLAVFAILAAIASRSPFVIVPGCVYLVSLLFAAYGRSVRNASSQWRFLEQQDRFINYVSGKTSTQLNEVAVELRKSQLELFPRAEVDKFTNALNMRIALNRTLYLWAYQLHHYRQTAVSFALNGVTYAALFFGSAITITTVNVALLHLDPSQFSFGTTPSILDMAVYSTSSLAFNAGGGIESAGDWANVIRLSAGCFGFVFLATFVANIALSYRRVRDESAIRETVRRLKRMAAEDERELKSAFNMDIGEALRYLDRLGANLAGVVAGIVANIPADFFEDER